MKMKRSTNALSLFLCMVLVVAMALFTTGCNGNTDNENQVGSERKTTQETDVNSSKNEDTSLEEGAAEDGVSADVTVLGEGEKQFSFTVVDGEGNETPFEIHTDKETVGEALLDLELITGEEGDYGLYVKTVNGITADYDKDGTYWAFYVNGEYATSGVDITAVKEGDTYSFQVEK